MKTIKDILNKGKQINEAYGADHLSKADIKGRPMGFTRGDLDAPAVLILKRKAIRIYPDNQKVALYYAQQVDKYISVPFGGRTKEIAGTISEGWFSDDEIDPKTLAAAQKYMQQQKNRQKAISDVAAGSSDWQAVKHKETYKAKQAQNTQGSTAYRLGRQHRLALMRLASKVLGRKSPLTRPTGEPETEAPTQQASTIQKQSRKPKPPKPTKTQTQPSQQPLQPEKIKLGREEIKDPKLIQQLMKKATP